MLVTLPLMTLCDENFLFCTSNETKQGLFVVIFCASFLNFFMRRISEDFFLVLSKYYGTGVILDNIILLNITPVASEIKKYNPVNILSM